MINFPPSPIDGQTYTVGTVTYTYTSANKSWSTVRGTVGADFITNNRVIVRNTTPSDAPNTGALTVVGGVGIGGNLNVGQTIYSAGARVLTTVDFTQIAPGSFVSTILRAGTGTAVSTSTGDITVWSTATLDTVLVNGNQSSQGLYIYNTTPSNDPSSGAVTVAGGVGVGEDLYAQGNLYSQGNVLVRTPLVTMSDTAPLNPYVGDFWIETTTGIEYQYIQDGTNPFWVQFVGV